MTSKKKSEQNPEEISEDIEAEIIEEEVPEEEKKELDPIEELQEQLKLKDIELTEVRGDFLREKADLDNFRKRLIKDKEDAVQFANQRLLRELVQINDNLERALETPNASLESLKEGVKLIQKQFASFLKNQKVEPIEAMGKPFDPNLHEVMTQLESEEHDEGTVIQEYSKGYTLNGRILHSSKVVTSKKPSAPPSEEEAKEEEKNGEE